jgi:hypothetical protein
MIDSFNKTRTKEAYKLDWDISHLGNGEIEYDAWVLNFPSHPGTSIYGTNQFDFFPNPVEFGAIGSFLTETDYPYTDVRWPIMSKRMLDVLLSVGSFSHRTYPVLIIDYEIDLNKRTTIKGTKIYDYVLVQLTEHLDGFDFENSVYQRSTINPDIVTNIRWLSLKEVKDFPPLFSVKESRLDLLVSSKARAALEASSIQGINFLHVEDKTAT